MERIKNWLGKLLEDKEYVAFYPTYGYRKGNDWIIPMRFWVYEPIAITEGISQLE